MTRIQIDPKRIEAHGKHVKTAVRKPMADGLDKLNAGGTIEGGDFSITGTPLGMAYPIALQWAYQDLKAHLETLDSYADKLANTAKTYAAAEQANIAKG